MAMSRYESRQRRRRRVRKKIAGSDARPRLSVYRSLKHIYAQVIDDDRGVTIASASTMDKGFTPSTDDAPGKAAKAKAVGLLLAERCKAKGLERLVFDRNGYLYHGRVQAVADGAREGGLEL